jgi:hypothetical protein
MVFPDFGECGWDAECLSLGALTIVEDCAGASIRRAAATHVEFDRSLGTRTSEA